MCYLSILNINWIQYIYYAKKLLLYIKKWKTHVDISSNIRFNPACSSDSLGSDP